MARQIADSLLYQGEQFLDARTVVKQIADFANGNVIDERYYPDGFVAYCEEDCGYYQYLTGNEASLETGRWRRIGGLVDHQTKLGADGKPDYLGVKISSDPDVYKIDEDCIHIFNSDSLNYNVGTADAPQYEEVKIHTVFKLSDEAKTSDLLTNKWTISEEGLAGDLVVRYEKGVVLNMSLEDTAWYSVNAAAEVLTTGIKVDGILYPYETIDFNKFQEWTTDRGLLAPMDLAATEFFTADQDATIVVKRKSQKFYDCLGNLTKVRQNYTLPWDMINDSLYKQATDRGIIINEAYDSEATYDENYGARIVTSLGNKYNLVSKVNKREIKTGWTYEEDGGWTKVFPADVELDIDSENPVSNSAVVRGIAKAGHTANLTYDSEDKVLTLELRDKDSNVLSKVAVGLGSVNVNQPKVVMTLTEDLYDVTEGEQAVQGTIVVEKTTNNIQKVEVLDGETEGVLVDFTSEVTGETQTFIFNENYDATQSFKVRVTDVVGLIAVSEIVKANFVKPCLFNENGVDFVKALNLKGEDKFKFNFNETPQVGDPVISAKAIIKIPEEMITEFGEIVGIMGGKTKKYLYTDYSESFDKEIDSDNGYYVYTLKTKCGLQDFYFETLR